MPDGVVYAFAANIVIAPKKRAAIWKVIRRGAIYDSASWSLPLLVAMKCPVLAADGDRLDLVDGQNAKPSSGSLVARCQSFPKVSVLC